MFKFVSLAFGQTPKPAYPNLSIEPETQRAIVAAHSHGNVRLQAGRFYTREDVDAEFETLGDAEFVA
ncbi:hypothetical protein [Sphingomonas sp. UYEF23]|uniref:hypothetical protein n=1 Tax=Sphingomonas sp. UYEF23 TaxID=1756408 RepID=UPI00339354B4